MFLVSILRRYQFLDLLDVLVIFFGIVSLSFQPRSLNFFSFALFELYIQSPFSSTEGGLSAFFDSQIENFSSQVVQRLNSTEADFC